MDGKWDNSVCTPITVWRIEDYSIDKNTVFQVNEARILGSLPTRPAPFGHKLFVTPDFKFLQVTIPVTQPIFNSWCLVSRVTIHQLRLVEENPSSSDEIHGSTHQVRATK